MSSDFPVTPVGFDPSFNGGSDAFVAKLNLTGNRLVYATFLGGSSSDFGLAITVDAADSVYLTGGTWSNNFPTTPSAFDTSINGWQDAHAVKLSAQELLICAQDTNQPPTIDGNFDDWAQWPPLMLDRDTAFYIAIQPPGNPPPTPGDNSAELRAQWTTTDQHANIDADSHP